MYLLPFTFDETTGNLLPKLPKLLSKFSSTRRTSAAESAETTVLSVLAADDWRILKSAAFT
ncbi:hypothetical protein ACFS07_06615 [Undibacterium arcticum]